MATVLRAENPADTETGDELTSPLPIMHSPEAIRLWETAVASVQRAVNTRKKYDALSSAVVSHLDRMFEAAGLGVEYRHHSKAYACGSQLIDVAIQVRHDLLADAFVLQMPWAFSHSDKACVLWREASAAARMTAAYELVGDGVAEKNWEQVSALLDNAVKAAVPKAEPGQKKNLHAYALQLLKDAVAAES